jgi:hypothetical protein
MPSKKAKSAFVAALPYACRLWASRLRFFIVQLQRLEARDISHAIQKGKERLCGCPALCLSPLGEPPPLFYCPAPAARGSRHKSCHPKRQRAPLWLPCLMLVASGQAASAFRIVQLRRLEARDISHAIQKGKERLCGCPALCLSPLGEPPPLFYCPAPGLRGTCHKSNRPRRQRTPSCPVRHMPHASEQSPSAFLFTTPIYRL